MNAETIPTVMTIAGNDPTGGAGIAADIEAIISQGCHPIPIVSCITVQDTCDVIAVEAVDADLLMQQARAVLEDLPVDAIKLGLLGSEENVEITREILLDYPDIPVVLDPIIDAGGGSEISSQDTVTAMKTLLFDCVDLITPNTLEALALVPSADNAQAAIPALFELGCEWILLTGTHDNSDTVINRLYGPNDEVELFRWERLAHSYHGSGCTLSSALAGLLAQNISVPEAAAQAQDFTWRSLQNAYRLGMGQLHPNRLFWAQADDDDSV